MSEALVIDIGRDAVLTALMISAPALIIGMVVGLVISIFQATTQIQEQTLTFVPKIVAILLSIVIFGPWMLQVAKAFSERLLLNLHTFIS
ncbi:MAG TPA: flagellar biosynthesis protein FliQ [Firmicutes bacterium]|jgi:flagellar biosynthetic protein FliQ|nr:flagellar biosynthesis protein FliQ [Bacillota bacterium]